MEEKRSFAVPTVVALVLLLLPSLYEGAYYATVGKAESKSSGKWKPWYSVGGNAAEAFFYPVHWVDRKVRPGNWGDDDDWMPKADRDLSFDPSAFE